MNSKEITNNQFNNNILKSHTVALHAEQRCSSRICFPWLALQPSVPALVLAAHVGAPDMWGKWSERGQEDWRLAQMGISTGLWLSTHESTFSVSLICLFLFRYSSHRLRCLSYVHGLWGSSTLVHWKLREVTQYFMLKFCTGFRVSLFTC